MGYNDKIITSIHGRRVGLQPMSTAQTGGSRGKAEFLVGPQGFRQEASTAESTATKLKAWGHSVMDGSSAGSSSVFTIDPPIPGMEKVVVFNSTIATLYLKSANSETFQSSQGSTFTVLKSTSLASVGVRLVALTTAAWQVIGQLSTASIAAATST